MDQKNIKNSVSIKEGLLATEVCVEVDGDKKIMVCRLYEDFETAKKMINDLEKQTTELLKKDTT